MAAHPNPDSRKLLLSARWYLSKKAPPEHFTGSVRVEHVFQSKPPARAGAAYVTFEPCARSLARRHADDGDDSNSMATASYLDPVGASRHDIPALERCSGDLNTYLEKNAT
jgi:hypothetical protein